MMQTLAVAGLENIYLDLGHVGIYRALAGAAGLSDRQEAELFEALQRKATAEIEALVDSFGLGARMRQMLLALAGLNGGEEVLPRARRVLAAGPPEVAEAIDYVEAVAVQLHRFLPDLPVHFDLAELRAYRYQTGIVFAAFVPGEGQEVARGGRYDQIGEVFGRARPATGFSADLKALMRLGSHGQQPLEGAVLAPGEFDQDLQAEIARLRAAGTVVIRELPGQQGDPAQMGCAYRLQKQADGWDLVPL
jgi:ATP phosphoribosyltransferase regulatory subunit